MIIKNFLIIDRFFNNLFFKNLKKTIFMQKKNMFLFFGLKNFTKKDSFDYLLIILFSG